MTPDKPLGRKAYGSIPHLPGSRRGPGDHGTTEGMARILTEKVRDDRDRIIVTEKLDGSNVAVAKIDGALVALGRSGHTALSSKWEHIRLFDRWVNEPEQYERFDYLLSDGSWISGEWLALAHGTRYDLRGREPFAAFDLFVDGERLPTDRFRDRCWQADIQTVPYVDVGRPMSIEDALRALGDGGGYAALDPPEGAVWRVERAGRFEFIAKYVRPDKVDGYYIPEWSGKSSVWNWYPGVPV